MANNYAHAVRRATMAAARLHHQLDTQRSLQEVGGHVDVFGALVTLDVPLVFRPLKGLLGAYLPEPIPGVLITTERPLSIQRFTAAHELGHHQLQHSPSLDGEDILRRATLLLPPTPAAGDLQEVEADAFAAAFLMPRWLIQWHCLRQCWHERDFQRPQVVYQLSLRLGASFEATVRTLQRYELITLALSRQLLSKTPREIKIALLREHEPADYRGDVWLLTERDAATGIHGSRNDHFILQLAEHTGGGYLWNFDQLKESGFAIVRDDRILTDAEGVGGPTMRDVLTTPPRDSGPTRAHWSLSEARPWQPSAPLSEIELDLDFTGPEEEGYSRAERRRILHAA